MSLSHLDRDPVSSTANRTPTGLDPARPRPSRRDGGSGELETKFVFPAARLKRVIGLLAALCRPDGRHPHGVVSSLYFDTPDWFHYGEKRNSDYLKGKVRARWYADPRGGELLGNVFLEVKRKIGTIRRKHRMETDLPAGWLAARALDDPRLLELPHRLWSELAEQGVAPLDSFPAPLLPAFELRYRRRRFVEPGTGTRISVDYRIEIPRTNPRRLPPARPFPGRLAVLELKGDASSLPPALSPLGRVGLRKQSFSKYGACFEWLTGSPL